MAVAPSLVFGALNLVLLSCGAGYQTRLVAIVGLWTCALVAAIVSAVRAKW